MPAGIGAMITVSESLKKFQDLLIKWFSCLCDNAINDTLQINQTYYFRSCAKCNKPAARSLLDLMFTKRFASKVANKDENDGRNFQKCISVSQSEGNLLQKSVHAYFNMLLSCIYLLCPVFA
uniref:Uncharacterized protein n=1 Tax=Parascaris univalens TaxID=6257 RepID=A0A915CC17_PARUN